MILIRSFDDSSVEIKGQAHIRGLSWEQWWDLSLMVARLSPLWPKALPAHSFRETPPTIDPLKWTVLSFP